MKYKLLKDLPGIKAGEIFDEIGIQIFQDNCSVLFDTPKIYPDRFEEVIEIRERGFRYPENLMEGYCLESRPDHINVKPVLEKDRGVVENLYILGNRFPNREKAGEYIELKKHIALFIINKRKLCQMYYAGFGWGYHSFNGDNLNFDYCGEDFMMPLDSTPEELKERKRLLVNYYNLND